ncbi:MAG TPA: phosphate ABC transporter permease subunit PstC [Kineosporiaceae bacterium]|nr:phosphate ABC transporter permease subunit PstC [Kineosporiaceae bacterium]
MSSITGRSELDSQPSGDLAGSTRRLGDRVFAGLSVGSGVFVVVVIAAVAVFLIAQAWPSLRDDSVDFLTSRTWNPGGSPPAFGVADLLWVTVISSVVAMAIAVPISIGVALFLTQYAPPRLARPFAAAVDLLAAVPSIVYGLFGAYIVLDYLSSIQTGISTVLGWVPLFSGDNIIPNSIFAGSVILSVMILPIVTALSREVFAQTPAAHKEAALALGATRWEVIRTAVLPYGRPGVISASMLGLGRALGETIAVLLIINVVRGTFHWTIFTGGETFASRIARDAGEFDTPEKTGAYIAAGLVLFVLTFVVNAAARVVIERRKAFTE